MRRIVRLFLSAIGHTDVEEAHDRDSAQSLLQAKTFDLVLCDWILAAGNGRSVYAALRANRAAAATPFIMMVAQERFAEIDAAHRDGVRHVLVKPFDGQTLKAKLAEATAAAK